MKLCETQRLTLFLPFCIPFVAAAHPHSFILVCVKRRWLPVKMSNSVALKMRWTMDALSPSIHKGRRKRTGVRKYGKLAAEVGY